MFAHLAEAEAICHTLQEIGLSPSFKQRQWEVWPRSFTISQSHFYEALSSKVQSLHQGRFLHYVTVQSIHWRLWSLQKSWFWPLKIYVSYAQGKKKKTPACYLLLKTQLVFSILYHCCESFFFVHGTEKKCDGACKEGSVCRAALERSKKQPINCKRETLVSKFLQGRVREHGKKTKKNKKTEKRINTGQNNGQGKWIWPER